MKSIFTWVGLLLMFTICGCKKDSSANNTPPPTPPVTPPSNVATIKSFIFNDFTPPVTATLANDSIKFSLSIDPGVDPGLLKPTISFNHSGTTSKPISLIAQDFTRPVTYTVTAEDGKTSKTYYAKLTPPTSLKGTPKAPLKLCIFYGYPSLVNGSGGSISKAAAVFANFDIVVFGDHLYEASHPDHNNTAAIIAQLKALNPKIKTFGYIDVGSTQHLSTASLTAAISSWKVMGIYGVFGDEFGFDFGNDRARQNVFIDFAHNNGLYVFANAFHIDDALADNNSSATHLKPGDFYLLENFMVTDGKLNTFSDYQSRGQRAYYYMRKKGVGIAVQASLPLSSLNSSTPASDLFKYVWCGTAMYNFDALQVTDLYFSALTASNNYVNIFPNLYTSYGTFFIQPDWVTAASSTDYTRSTNSKTFHITNNGKASVTP
jgi:hypothetical protein